MTKEQKIFVAWDKATDLLVAKGYKASLEYPLDIHIEFKRSDGSGSTVKQLAVFGTANETIDGDLYASIEEYENGRCTHDGVTTGLSSNCEDSQRIADGIIWALDPDASELRLCALCACAIYPSGNLVNRNGDVFCSEACANEAEAK